jgi:hypothetical protein
MTGERSNANRDLRWPRLFAVFLWNFGAFFVGMLVAEFSWDVWKSGLGAISLYMVLVWLGRALGFALFLAFSITFATWLAQEVFGQTKNGST